MTNAILLLLLLLATASETHAGERAGLIHRFQLARPELFLLLDAPPSHAPSPLDAADRGMVAEHEDRASGLPPFFTLVPPRSPAPGDDTAAKPPLFTLAARVQGRTIVAFTRPGTRADPDDHVVYQRLVVSDLLEGRRFSVTVFEDHALGGSDSQMLGFGARLMLRPAIEIHGWRARVELFGAYDMTLGITGYVGITARSPIPPLILPAK